MSPARSSLPASCLGSAPSAGQGTAYALGALGPLLVGLLHDASTRWMLPLLFLVAVTLAAVIPAVTLSRPTADQYAPRMDSVILRPEGEAPTWSPDGTRHPLDGEIAAAKERDFATQKKLYSGAAGHLQANQILDDHSNRDDHRNDEEWLRRLAVWFGWSEAQHESVKAEVLKRTFGAEGDWDPKDA